MRRARRDSVPHVARAGNRRTPLHACGHHRARQAGASGMHGGLEEDWFARRKVPPCCRRGPGRAPKTELVGSADMNWEQLKTIIWLRWRLTRNQFLRAGQLNAVISVLLVVIMATLSVALAIGCT